VTPDPEDSIDPGDSGDSSESAVGETERQRRRAEVFGDVLAEQTRDDQASDRVDRSPDGSADEWLRSQVPPHHG
jgi:hypothetical protein